MTYERTMKVHGIQYRSKRMRGFSLVTAIFLLIVLAALGAAMVTISMTQNKSSSLDMQGVRAYQAARAGIEWGVFRWLRENHACNASSTFQLPGGTSLAGYTVTVTCAADNALGINTAVIRATACNMPVASQCTDQDAVNNPDYVRRVVEVRL